MFEELYSIVKENKEVFELYFNSDGGISIIDNANLQAYSSDNKFWRSLGYSYDEHPSSFFDTFYDKAEITKLLEKLLSIEPESIGEIVLFHSKKKGEKLKNQCKIFHYSDKRIGKSKYFLFHDFQFLEKWNVTSHDAIQKYKIYFDRSSIAMILFRLEDGLILEANTKLEENCGFNVDEYANLKVWDIIKLDKEEDREMMFRGIEIHERFGPLDVQVFCYKEGGLFPAFLDGISFKDEFEKILVWTTIRDQTRLRLTENELKINTEQLNSIVSIFPDLVFFLGPDGTVNNFYARDLKSYVFNDIQLKSNRIDTIFGVEIGGQFLKSIQVVLGETISDSFEYSYTTAKGEEWFEARFMQGAGEQVICIIRNISSQKKAEFNLDEERKLLRTIIDHIPLNIYVKDLNLKKIMANKAEYEFLGARSEKEVLGHPDSTFFPDETVSNSYNEDCYVIDKGKAILGKESKSIKKSGEENWIITNKIPFLNSAGQLKGLVGISYDITEKKQAENELKSLKEQYELAVTGSNDGIWDWRITEDKVFFSNRWKMQLGYEAHELKNELKTFTDRIHPIDYPVFERTFYEYKNRIIGHFRLEIRLKHKSGKYRWILSRGTGVFSDTGELVRLAGSHTDITERIEAQKELKEAKNFLVQTSAIAKLGGWETDFDTHRVFWTDMTKKIIGLPDDYVPQFEDGLRFFKEGYHREIVSEKLTNALKNGESFDVETKLQSPEGNEKWVRLLGKLEPTMEGSKKVVGTIQDIDEFKKLEDAIKIKNAELEESYRKISEITDSISDVLWSYRVDRQGNFLKESITRQVDEFLELPKGTIGDSFEKFFSYIHPDDLPSIQNEFQKLFIAGKSAYEVEYRMILPSGKIKWVNTNAKVYKGESEIYAVGRTTDINLRKQSERLLDRQSDLLKTLVSITSEFINLPLDLVQPAIKESLQKIGHFLNADSAFIFRYPPYNLPPVKLYEWSDPKWGNYSFQSDLLINELDSLWCENLKLGNYFSTNNLNTSEKEIKQFLDRNSIKTIISFPLMDGSECTGFVGFQFFREQHVFSEFEIQLLKVFSEVLVNIRKRSLLQEHLIAAKEEAENANKSKSEFLANMSHEIRTPLNGVIGFTDLLMNSTLNDEQLQFARSAHTSAYSLLGLINDILDFTKIEAGKMELEEIKTDIIDLVEQTADIVKFSSAKKGIEFLLNIGLNVPRFLYVDAYRLKQILINLLSNAIKFTNFGEVELTLEFHHHLQEKNRGEFKFSVRDTGIGISIDQQKNLFKSFSQADASTTRKFGGTGLGLVIAEMLANKMGSTIHLESQLNEGSVFSFNLQKEYLDGHKLDKIGIEIIKRVLIIDDNVKNIKILERILKHWGMQAVSAVSGSQALEILNRQNEFNLLIVDFHMPEMDGLQTINKIVSHYAIKGLERPRIILYSSADDSYMTRKAEELPIDFKLIKPAKITELLFALNSIYNRQEIDATNDQYQEISLQKVHEFTEKIKILIAEDVPLNMLLVKTYLNNNFSNFDIIEAGDGELAISQYEKFLPDLVLMDVQMPKKDGYEATRQIRILEEKLNRSIPIIALTAGAIQEEKDKSTQSGMNDFLTKPINKNELLKTIKFHLKIN